jgi:hypothetical protein
MIKLLKIEAEIIDSCCSIRNIHILFPNMGNIPPVSSDHPDFVLKANTWRSDVRFWPVGTPMPKLSESEKAKCPYVFKRKWPGYDAYIGSPASIEKSLQKTVIDDKPETKGYVYDICFSEYYKLGVNHSIKWQAYITSDECSDMVHQKLALSVDNSADSSNKSPNSMKD